MKLIIVESPTKANTIKKFLDKGYNVLSSFGHIRDLPKSELGIDIEKNFEPRYIIPTKAKKNITLLKKESKSSDETILATDEDREGESIAWHLQEILKLKKPKRIVFHEITKPAIERAIENPREIDLKLVNAQQARRILDRIVGYKLSPFLWKKIARGLSAGRVQSVAVRLIAEREEEIKKFKEQEYWEIEAELKKQSGEKNKFTAILSKIEEKTLDQLSIKTKEEAEKIKENLKTASFEVLSIEKKEIKKNPLPPLTTSYLQQEAWKKFKFPAKVTMFLAQHLYEQGFITYHRTDSLNLSEISLSEAKKFIEENLGKEYYPGFSRKYKSKGKAQEAHEAIRPTFADRTPEKIKDSGLNERQQKLYGLIWSRFIACQMNPAIFDSSVAEISAGKYCLKASGQILKFDGFLKVFPLKFEEKELPELEVKESLNLERIIPSQHFTQPPARYNEATLIKTLEENGIGRPSTYAPIISTIQARNYVEKNDQKRFAPTEIGTLVNGVLTEHFPEIVDISFTAKMEEELDEIADGQKEWTEVCSEFYGPFSKNLENKYSEVKNKETVAEKTDKICPECASPLVIKFGRFGKFYACSAFPKCKHTEAMESKTLGIKCPKCKIGDIIEKRSKRGKVFYGCNKFPKCDFALWDKPILGENGEPKKCLECGSPLVEMKKGIKCSNKDCKTNKKMAE
jgi:DNA topoisomerase I